MSDKLIGGSVRAGSTSVTLFVFLRASSTGAGLTGIAFGSATAYYLRQGGTPQAITLAALGSVNAAFSAGGWFEVDSVHMPGLYRLDVPDGAWPTGADFVEIEVGAAGAQPYAERLTITTDALITGDPYALLNTAFEATPAGSLGTLNIVGAMKLVLSLLLSIMGGGGTGAINIRDVNNLKNRVVITVDQNGNRQTVTFDVT